MGNRIGQGISNLGQLLGIRPPSEGSPQTLRTIVSVLDNSAVQTALSVVPPPGAGLLLRMQVSGLSASLRFLDFAWQTYQNPQPLLDRIREALGRKMANVGPLAMQAASAAVHASGPARDSALNCIWRHLRPKLEYIGRNWWDVLKGMGMDILWPWPGVASDFRQIWSQLKLAGTALWELRINDSIDHLLAALRHLNSALGRLYGWFFIASVLVGTGLGLAAGTAAGGVGAGPGAAAGATAGLAFAGEVGLGLLISTLAVELLSIVKSGYNLTRTDRTAQQRECDCEIISGSSITVAICGALAILGAVAARLARGLLQRVANRLFDPPQTPPRSTRRGRVVEARVSLGELIKARFRMNRVTVTDRLTPGGLLGESGNFPGIDVATDAQITIRTQGQPIGDAAALRAAMRNNQPITVDISGGRIVSVRSRGGANAFDRLRGDINQLANFQTGTSPSFTAGSTSRVTASITNPASRVLIGVYESGRLTAAEIASLQQLAAQRGVTLRLHQGIPPNPIALTTIESMPRILGEIAAEGFQVLEDQSSQETGLACALPS
ncbi:MAG: hypothetical protein JNK85_11615 [Verrucomicrobiales bacterium]|nr:hypothetical protein [Verrucomicrobiales bacterium]